MGLPHHHLLARLDLSSMDLPLHYLLLNKIGSEEHQSKLAQHQVLVTVFNGSPSPSSRFVFNRSPSSSSPTLKIGSGQQKTMSKSAVKIINSSKPPVMLFRDPELDRMENEMREKDEGY
ncbi:unnamed protein product [Microthlaspi erraticum]|uniref:Uncharacterized protein n=1 Tax=Microthlaspi erraticum TaxID=1685480 RepID=A0A6D2IY12_9BRAS|nr:unnamed protein product [Microthlaspi erraticum]